MKSMRNVSQYDNRTGELLEGVFVYCGVKYNPYGKGFIMNSQEALDLLAEDPDLTKDALRVLLKLCAKLDFENWIYITQTDICNELKINKSNVSKAIKLLISKNIILKGPKIGRSFGYRLNPDYGWKGKVKNLNEYRKEVEEREKQDFKKNHLGLNGENSSK